MQITPQTQAFIMLYRTMPPQTKQEFAKWITEHPKEIDNSTDLGEEQNDFYTMAGQNLNRAYTDNEPEYTEVDLLEINLNFNPR